MRIIQRDKSQNLYLVESFNVTGKIQGYVTISKTTGSLKDAKSIARAELSKGASHVNVSKVLFHCFSSK